MQSRLLSVKIADSPEVFYRNVDEFSAVTILDNAINNKQSHKELIVSESKILKKIVLRNCGVINPESIEDYLQNNGYQAINIKFCLNLVRSKQLMKLQKAV